MNLATVPFHAAFADAVAGRWLDRAGDDPLAVAHGMILLPTRRAARAMQDAFLARTDGRPMLLPRIVAFGALDEAPLALAGALDLAPAVSPPLRLAQLSRLILAMGGRYGTPVNADQAWPLAAELAALMDEAERAEIDLAAKLPGLVAADYAHHWQVTLDFLQIVTAAWPAWLAENGVMNPAARQVALLKAQARAWQDAPPDFPVLAGGSTGGIPAVAALLRVVAALPQGEVVLPGLDLTLPDPLWDALGDGHPQSGLARLLDRLGARRGDVTEWDVPAVAPPGRTALLSLALLPAAGLQTWQRAAPAAPGTLYRLTPADQQEEALATALIMRDALDVPGRRVALVTPDRDLAGRVAAELRRFGIMADDSAGEPLADTPPGTFLRLLAEAVAEDLRPVPLLSLLKHPYAAAGLPQAACRAAARALERHCLRGPSPPPGLAGLRQAAKGEADLAFIDRLEACLSPLLAVAQQPRAAPAAALAALLAAAEALAAAPGHPGAERLWVGEDGQALATTLAELLPAIAVLPDQPPATLPGLLEAALAGLVVRSRRALRGRDGAEHPRIFIWGLLEARLQRADLLILGGLAEGVWPAAADPGPWMSRPMRAAADLPSPEEAIGQAAHDFAAAACAAPEVVLSCPRRRDGAPAVPARWLQRLDALLRGTGHPLPEHPAAHWARALDQPAAATRRPPPEPRPPLADRPRQLSVTEVETWLRDPYGLYAKHILRLRALQPIEESADASDYGQVVHAAIAAFLRDIGPNFPPDAEARLLRAMDAALAAQALRPALAAWWRPRLHRIATWLAEAERGRRLGTGLAELASERDGQWLLDTATAFTLTGRADRIERRYDGAIAILDYKTGAVPDARDVLAGLAPQLPLEAAMAMDGAFGPEMQGRPVELVYWHLSGGYVPGEVRPALKDNTGLEDVVATARAKLAALVHTYDDPAQPYLSRPHPGQAPRFSDYTQLARVAEWSAAEEE